MGEFKRKTAAAVLAAAAAASVIGVSAPSASAAGDSCPHDRVCVFDHHGHRAVFRAGQRIDLTRTRWNNDVAFIGDRTPFRYCAYKHAMPFPYGRHVEVNRRSWLDLRHNHLSHEVSVLVRGGCATPR